MRCYRASTAHGKSRRRARRRSRPAPVGRSPAPGTGGPVDTGPALVPRADRGPHHDRAPRPGRERHDRPPGRSTAAWGTTLSAGTTRMSARSCHRRRRRKGLRPHRGPGPRVLPRAPPSKIHWAPRLLLPGTLPLAARLRRERQRPAARVLLHEGPTGRHRIRPRSNRCAISAGGDRANASAGKPLRGPTRTARCASYEKPRP